MDLSQLPQDKKVRVVTALCKTYHYKEGTQTPLEFAQEKVDKYEAEVSVVKWLKYMVLDYEKRVAANAVEEMDI